MSGAFQRVEQTNIDSVGGKPASKKYVGIRVLDTEQDEYKLNHSQGKIASSVGGDLGTRVPKSSRTGGIEGKGNKGAHGLIVMGNTLTVGDGDGSGFKVLSELEPTPALVGDEVLSEEKVQEGEDEDEEEEDLPEDIVRDLEEFQEYLPPPAPVGEGLPEQSRYPFTPVKKKRVKMQGTFGSYRGKYLDLVDTGDLVVLLYDPEDPVYSPPASQETFTISCGGQKHTVYFAGIEFELDALGRGIQVFIKSE